jgi:hypothetical protein
MPRRDGADHRSDLGFKSTKIPKIGTATEWHDGQFAHDTHAPISLGLSGKSVIAEIQAVRLTWPAKERFGRYTPESGPIVLTVSFVVRDSMRT